MKRYIIPREYTAIPASEVKITIVEGTGSLLGAMSRNAQSKACEYLGKLGVDVVLNHFLKSYEGHTALLDNGDEIPSGMVIWTAGIVANSFNFTGFSPSLARGGRIKVDSRNLADGSNNIYVVGDMAYMSTDRYPSGHPQLAQVAIQQSINLARNLNRKLEDSTPFVYRDKGTMATVGRNMAVADLKSVKLSGRLAWMVWMFIHLISILGMRNKLTVLINWIWAYCTYSTSLRQLIYQDEYPLR